MSKLRSQLALSGIALLFLSACGSAKGTNLSTCPPPQWPDAKVAEELVNVPYEGFEDTWSWIDRVEKLNEQLEVCRHG